MTGYSGRVDMGYKFRKPRKHGASSGVGRIRKLCLHNRRTPGVFLKWVLIFGLGCTLEVEADQYRPPADYQLPLQQYQLENGLDVVVNPNRIMPIVQISVVVHAGSIVETASTDGFAHFVEHLLVDQGLAESDQEDLFYQLREQGVVYNASTSSDFVMYYYNVLRDKTDEIMPLIAQSITYPTFAPHQVENERGAILAEIDLNESDPTFLAFDEMTRLLFSDYPEKRIVLGNREVIENATPADLEYFHSQWYVPSNAALVFSGDIEVDDARHMADEFFGKWPRKENPFETHPVPTFKPFTKDSVSVLHGQVSDTTLIMAWRGPDTKNDRRTTIVGDVLEAMTARSANVFRYLVDERYSISAGLKYIKKRYSGVIEVVLKIPQGNEEDTIRYLMVILRELINPEYLPRDELEATKDEMWINWVASLDEATNAGYRVSTNWGIADTDYFIEYVDNVSSIQNRDIKDFVTKYMLEKPKVAVLLTSSENAERNNLTTDWLEDMVAW